MIVQDFVVFVGGCFYWVLTYIKSQVAEGQEKIGRAKERVNQGNSLFSLNPLTEKIGEKFSEPVQSKIKEGEMEVQKYEKISHYLTIFGALSLIVGIGLFFLRRKKS